MLPALNSNHVSEALKLLIQQFKRRPVIEGFLSTYVRRLQDAENVLWQLIDARILSTAVDGHLDRLGDLAGEKRLGRNDTDYRAAIRLRIRVNRSKGRITDIIDVAILANPHGTPRVTEYKYLGFEVEIYNEPGQRYVGELLQQTRAAATYGLFIGSDLPWTDVLAFDDAVSPIAGIETFGDYWEEFPP